MTAGARRVSLIVAGLALIAGVVVTPPVHASTDAAPTSRLSTAARATVPQVSVSMAPFSLPAKGECRDVPLVFDVRGKERMRIEVDITTLDDESVGTVILGRAATQRFPREGIQICRKAFDDGSSATVPIRPNTDYVFELQVQVGGRKGPTYTDSDFFTTGR